MGTEDAEMTEPSRTPLEQLPTPRTDELARELARYSNDAHKVIDLLALSQRLEREASEWKSMWAEVCGERERLSGSLSEESARARELWLVLANLSFHCDGVLCTVPPPREVYNESFAVMDRLKPLYGPEAPK
jgi:hypothetical protein